MHHDPPNFCGFTAKLAGKKLADCPNAIASDIQGVADKEVLL